MEDREPRIEAIVGQIGIEVGELVGRAKSLVGNGSEGQGAHIEPHVLGASRLLDAAARSESTPLAVLLVAAERASEDELLDDGSSGARRVTKSALVDGNWSPTHRFEGFGGSCLLDHRPAEAGIGGIQEQHGDTRSLVGGPEQSAGHRQEDPGPVSGKGVGGHGSSVLDPAQGLQSGINDRARGPAPRIGDETDPAGIFLGPARVVKGHVDPFGSSSEAPCRWRRARKKAPPKRAPLLLDDGE